MTRHDVKWAMRMMPLALPVIVMAAARAPQVPALSARAQKPSATDMALLPEGDGRDAVLLMCVPCHGIPHAIVNHKTARGWRATVDDMLEKGAQGTDEQADAAVGYLSRFFLAVDVNHATADEIARVADLSAADAAAIVAYRAQGNSFKSYADVARVPGLDPLKLAAAKEKLAYAAK